MLNDYLCEVADHQQVGHQLYILTFRPLLKTGVLPFQCQPGQFVMIDLPTEVFYFRRPMSVLNAGSSGTFQIFYKVYGRGTAMMAQMSVGQTTRVLGPLGNTFRLPEHPGKTLLIGGGIGIAPLYFWGNHLKSLGYTSHDLPHCFYGARSMQDLGLLEPLSTLFGAKLHIATDDGSYGEHGHIGSVLSAHTDLLRDACKAYVCGPMAMMRSITNQLLSINPALVIEVSLEEHMPCGTGACSGCSVFRTDQTLPSKVCVEGPVFDARIIDWPTALPLKALSLVSCDLMPSGREKEAPCFP